jgi:hypothetical protein
MCTATPTSTRASVAAVSAPCTNARQQHHSGPTEDAEATTEHDRLSLEANTATRDAICT